MATHWFTFGSGHAHHVAGVTYDPDVVVQVTAEDPRSVMVEWFGTRWSMEYARLEDVRVEEFYPRGVLELPV